MRSLIIGAGVFLIASIILLMLGLSSSAPAAFAGLMFCAGPGFFLMLGAALGRLSRDYTIVPKQAIGVAAPRKVAPLG
jgi:hypothetical protein